MTSSARRKGRGGTGLRDDLTEDLQPLRLCKLSLNAGFILSASVPPEAPGHTAGGRHNSSLPVPVWEGEEGSDWLLWVTCLFVEQ